MIGVALLPTTLAVTLLAGLQAPAGGEDAWHQASQRLRALAARPNLTPENLFIHAQLSALLERWMAVPPGVFSAGRLELAVTHLLQASERIVDARDGRRTGDRSEETRRLMARDLERTYFRIQQGDYFSRQSQEAEGPRYVLAARRLYQLGRAAYDEREYDRVQLLSEAARDVIGALECLAQAVIGVPDPPRLPEG